MFLYIDYIFNGIFIIEFIMKIITQGFYFDNFTYLTEAWNILDFIIMIISVLDIILID